MPVVKGATAPVFSLPGTTFTGLAAPSRGAKETCVWRISVDPGTPPTPHRVDKEEIFVLTSGRMLITLAGAEHALEPGDVLIVPADTLFGLDNPYQERAELVVVMPVGGVARIPGQDPILPPWAQ